LHVGINYHYHLEEKMVPLDKMIKYGLKMEFKQINRFIKNSNYSAESCLSASD